MNEPARLRDDGASSLERALLEAGRSYRSTQATRAKTLAALGLAGSAVFSGVAAASSLLEGAWGKVLWVASTALVTAGLPLAYFALQEERAAVDTSVSAPLRSPAVPAMPVPGQPNRATPVAATPVAAAPVGTKDVAAVADGTGQGSPERRRVAPRPAERASLTEELQSLDSARALLSSGNSGGSLRALDEYARSFPQGRLRLEAEVVRIEALAKNGQVNLATKRARSFVARYPKSALASRVRRYLSDG